MIDKSLKAILRGDIGSNKVKKLRKEAMVPGVVYRKGEPTKSFAVDELEFTKLFRQVGTSALFELDMEGEKIPAIVKSVQRDPVKGSVTHIDLQKLNMEQRIKLQVPITLLNRDNIALQPSILMQMMDAVEIECLPGDIPESVGIDVSGMDFSTPILVKDLDIMKDERLAVLTDPEQLICSLNPPSVSAEADTEEESPSPEVAPEKDEDTEE
jgi:large subunit ribosomal protein L25